MLINTAGEVKLIGFLIDAALEGQPPPHPLYGDLTAREADVINLAAVLYAALVGRWPGVAPSAVPAAPVDGRRPLRPRQVRAGIPRHLDAICERVLNKEASQHVLPIETAHEVAAALNDFVGDPAAAAPTDLPSFFHDPSQDVVRPNTETDDAKAVAGLAGTSATEAPPRSSTDSAGRADRGGPTPKVAEPTPRGSDPCTPEPRGADRWGRGTRRRSRSTRGPTQVVERADDARARGP